MIPALLCALASVVPPFSVLRLFGSQSSGALGPYTEGDRDVHGFAEQSIKKFRGVYLYN